MDMKVHGQKDRRHPSIIFSGDPRRQWILAVLISSERKNIMCLHPNTQGLRKTVNRSTLFPTARVDDRLAISMRPLKVSNRDINGVSVHGLHSSNSHLKLPSFAIEITYRIYADLLMPTYLTIAFQIHPNVI